MKTYAAPAGMKNWRGQQMIQIHQHRRKQDQPVLFPVFPVVPVGNGTDEDEVEEVVGEGLKQSCQLSVVSWWIKIKKNEDSDLQLLLYVFGREPTATAAISFFCPEIKKPKLQQFRLSNLEF